MIRFTLSTILVLTAAAPSLGAAGPERPTAVSPGSPAGAGELVDAASACPTFSWGSVAEARSYELVVYRLGEAGEEAEPVLRQSFAGSVSSWNRIRSRLEIASPLTSELARTLAGIARQRSAQVQPPVVVRASW